MIACLYLVLCCNLIASSFCMLKKSSVKWTNACTGYMRGKWDTVHVHTGCGWSSLFCERSPMASQSGRFSTTQSYVFLKENYRYYLNWFRYLHITVNSLLTETSLKLTLTLDLIYLRLYFIYYYKTLSKMGICTNVINIICQCKFSFTVCRKETTIDNYWMWKWYEYDDRYCKDCRPGKSANYLQYTLSIYIIYI